MARRNERVSTLVPKEWYDDVDVLEAARSRLRAIADTHDHLIVSFSGGKDSLVVLLLTAELYAERGLGRVPVAFYDEELIPTNVLEVVDHYRRDPRFDLKWLAVPLSSSKHSLGTTEGYIQWGEGREWLRTPPEWAIRTLPGRSTPIPQADINGYLPGLWKMNGKVAVLVGLRAAEGHARFWVFARSSRPEIRKSEVGVGVSVGRPIYDWEEDDVLRFMYESGEPYAEIYDAQSAAGADLRVSTPLHPARMRYAVEFQGEVDPEFWDGVTKIFPEARLHERYAKDLAKLEVGEVEDLAGVRAWIDANVPNRRLHGVALKRLKAIARSMVSRPGAFPMKAVLRYFADGSYIAKPMLPKQEKKRPDAN